MFLSVVVVGIDRDKNFRFDLPKPVVNPADTKIRGTGRPNSTQRCTCKRPNHGFWTIGNHCCNPVSLLYSCILQSCRAPCNCSFQLLAGQNGIFPCLSRESNCLILILSSFQQIFCKIQLRTLKPPCPRHHWWPHYPFIGS